jgi:hypothetical protein
MKIQWDKVWEAVKLPLRLIVLAILPVIIVELSKVPDLYGVFMYTVLVAIDRYLHIIWKEVDEEPEGIYKVKEGVPVGLLPF